MSQSKPLHLIIESALMAAHEPLSLQDIANLFDEKKPSKNQINEGFFEPKKHFYCQ